MALDGTGTAPVLCGGDENELLRTPHREILPLRCPLKPRQIEAIEWAAKGKTMQETCEIMGLKKFTVQVYVRDARSATGAATIASLVYMAVKNHWIE